MSIENRLRMPLSKQRLKDVGGKVHHTHQGKRRHPGNRDTKVMLYVTAEPLRETMPFAHGK